MKAKNEAAERFQAKIADEVIPSIRKHGAYMTPETLDRMITSPEFGIRLLRGIRNGALKGRTLRGEAGRSMEQDYGSNWRGNIAINIGNWAVWRACPSYANGRG